MNVTYVCLDDLSWSVNHGCFSIPGYIVIDRTGDVLFDIVHINVYIAYYRELHERVIL